MNEERQWIHLFAIHGGTTFYKTSSLEGILDILLSKFKTENNSKNIISGK